MYEPDGDTLLLGDRDGRDQVAVARQQGSVADLLLAREESEVEAQEKVHPLLLKDPGTCRIEPPGGQPPFSDLVLGSRRNA